MLCYANLGKIGAILGGRISPCFMKVLCQKIEINDKIVLKIFLKTGIGTHLIFFDGKNI